MCVCVCVCVLLELNLKPALSPSLHSNETNMNQADLFHPEVDRKSNGPLLRVLLDIRS